MADSLEKILESSFLDYSAFVLQRRAIPDARDGMKYTARQILHAQAREKLDDAHPFKKSQKSVSAATSFSYVHGDTSAYEQIIRMGRPLVQRYHLETINGNSGTPTGSGTYSAPRYTEARLSALTGTVMNFLGENVLEDKDWSPTYDEEGVFPTVLPSVGFYNLCNGSFGSIGVGLISSIPQFNLREMNDAICRLIDNSFDMPELLPDFASGGILLNPRTTAASLARGEGKSALVRGKIVKNPKEGWLEVKELPYGVYTNTVCIELEKALDKGKPPFTSFKDLSQRGVQIRIYSKNLNELEQWLYKNTSVQKHFTIKLIMLDNGKTPKKFSLHDALLAHIAHAKKVFRKHYVHQLNLLKNRQEILEGLIKAYSILDEVIALIKASSGRQDSIAKLVSQYEFTTAQAEAIVDLRLHRLSNMDIQKFKDELTQNLKEQDTIKTILTQEKVFNSRLKDVYKTVADTYGDKRRTVILDSDQFECGSDGKITGDVVLMYDGNCFYTTYDTEGDEWCAAHENLHSSLTWLEYDQKMLIITNKMRAFCVAGKEFTMGENRWENFVKLNKGEHIVAVIQQEEMESNFEFLEITDADGKTYALHVSFINPLSKRGKKLVKGNYDVTSVEWQETTSDYPRVQ